MTLNQTLQIYLGSLYVNSFNAFGRYWQVTIQAEGDFRDRSSGHQSAASPQPRRHDGAAGNAGQRARNWRTDLRHAL